MVQPRIDVQRDNLETLTIAMDNPNTSPSDLLECD
jgi:hypothetical protein